MEDFVSDRIREMQNKITEARKRYDPLVRRLTDPEFVAIFQAVMEERDRRVAQLILTNPLVRQHAIDQLMERLKEENQLVEDGKN